MGSEASYPAGLRLTVILSSLFFGTFLVAIDTTIVSVAIPKISTQFHALEDVGWYGSAYLITITALQPAVGTIYKLFDAKLVYLAAIVVFEAAGSTLCAAAPTSPVFILGRAVAGSGAALLIQGAISVITHVAPLEKRALYIGLVVSCFGISASFSPVIGGALTDKVSWRWCFWINLPTGALIFFLVMLGLRLKIERNPMRSQSLRDKVEHLDPLGVILLLGGKLYYLPFYFQAVLGGSALRSGVEFLPLSIPQVIATVIAGGLATQYGHYFPIMLVGTIVCSVGTGLLIRIQKATPVHIWAISMVIAGLGDGLCTNMPYTAIQAILDDEADVFIGNAIATFATLAGFAIGVSTGETILVGRLLNEVPKYTTSVAPQAVISAGALNLSTLTNSISVLDGLRQAYRNAISTIMLCATTTICIANLTTLGMKRLNLKKISREREINKAAAIGQVLPHPQEVAEFDASNQAEGRADEGSRKRSSMLLQE
ncbi:MAG: hypothetical protein Q9225_001932 [Loekoesia sp. 1 TL-2023]